MPDILIPKLVRDKLAEMNMVAIEQRIHKTPELLPVIIDLCHRYEKEELYLQVQAVLLRQNYDTIKKQQADNVLLIEVIQLEEGKLLSLNLREHMPFEVVCDSIDPQVYFSLIRQLKANSDRFSCIDTAVDFIREVNEENNIPLKAVSSTGSYSIGDAIRYIDTVASIELDTPILHISHK